MLKRVSRYNIPLQLRDQAEKKSVSSPGRDRFKAEISAAVFAGSVGELPVGELRSSPGRNSRTGEGLEASEI